MTNTIPNRQIAEEAADWAVRIDCGPLDDAACKTLADWLTASPTHVSELLHSSALMAGMGMVDHSNRISLEELLADHAPEVISLFCEAQDIAANDIGTLADSAQPVAASSSVLSGKGWTVLAASLALILMAGVFAVQAWYTPHEIGVETDGPGAVAVAPDGSSYATQVGEQRSIALEDGSVIYLNTNSQLQVAFSQEERRIELVRGEAMFDVAHDAERPFRVYAKGTVIQAVGTQFNVQRTAIGVDVVVVEGTVLVNNQDDQAVFHEAKSPLADDQTTAISPVILTAGELVHMDVTNAIPLVSQADIRAATLWRTRQLLFESERLELIALEFNRYNRRKIAIADEALAEMRFSGTFNADDPDSFIAFLELAAGVEIDKSQADQVLIASDQG